MLYTLQIGQQLSGFVLLLLILYLVLAFDEEHDQEKNLRGNKIISFAILSCKFMTVLNFTQNYFWKCPSYTAASVT